MKFIKVIGLVLFFHASLLGVLFFQPGCQTMENFCVASQSVPATDYVEYSPDDAAIFKEESWVAVNEAPVMSTTNMRSKPTRPAPGSFDNNAWAGKTEASKPVADATYLIKSGDSLWVVAKNNGLSVADLAAANGISKDAVLKVGQKLIIPSNKGSAGMASPSSGGSSYTIAKGDTLSEIAARFHVSIDDLKNANNMKDNVIYAGKTIVIPGVSSKTVASVAAKAKSSLEVNSVSKDGTYQVKNGDSLSVIAGRFGVTVSDLMKWNNIADAAKLRAGQTIVVKGSSSKAVVAPAIVVPVSDKISELDAFIIEPSEGSVDEDIGFELFPDDILFDTSEEIPVITIVEE